MRQISRNELFEAAWARPLTKVAAEFGVTSTALKKICDRHDIPVPGRGYWAAVASGKVFPRPGLRPVEDHRLEEVLIRGATPAMTAVMAINVVPPNPMRFADQIKANRSLGSYEYSGNKHQQRAQPATIQIMMPG